MIGSRHDEEGLLQIYGERWQRQGHVWESGGDMTRLRCPM